MELWEGTQIHSYNGAIVWFWNSGEFKFSILAH